MCCPYVSVHFLIGEPPPIYSYYLITLAGPLNLPMYFPKPKGILITVSSANNLSKNGVTSYLFSGPPKFNIKTAVLKFYF